jgi:hypothetical protein
MAIMISTSPVSMSYRRTVASSRPALEALGTHDKPGAALLPQVAVKVADPDIVAVGDL